MTDMESEGGILPRKYLTTREACDYLGIKEPGTLYAYIREGKLKAHKLGGNGNGKQWSRRPWRIKLEDLEAFASGKTTDSRKED